MTDRPLIYKISSRTGIPEKYDNHITRHISQMKNQFYDHKAYNTILEREDVLVYEVYEINRPKIAGELLHGISIVHSGKVGDEYFMTKGHFHAELETAEVYYCLQGEGVMVMQTPEGDCSVEPLQAGGVLYVPPRWAHRSVNTSRRKNLVTFFVYPGNAGHDYGSIESHGLRKIVVERDGRTLIVDNPHWLPLEE